MKAYWWRPWTNPDKSRASAQHLRYAPVRNFGDQLNTFILSQMGLDHQWAYPEDAEIAICGSILEHLPDYWPGTVVGAGKLTEKSRIHLADARVFALRGKLTLAGCTGVPRTPVLGDPGLLAPVFVRQPGSSYPLGVVPHHSDKELWGKYSYGHLIDPTQPVHKVIEEIARCKRVITSSLHGAVIADAYQIPRQIELMPDPLGKEGGEFKFRDYQSVYSDPDPHFGKLWTADRLEVEKIRKELHAALVTATGIDLAAEPRHPQTSILVPFRDSGEERARVWKYLRKYWRSQYPGAEIIMGESRNEVFCKSEAVNDAASRARGRVFAIIDADTYIQPATLTHCADRIEAQIRRRHKLWFMPYDKIWRLSETTTLDLIGKKPYALPSPPPVEWAEDISVSQQSGGHAYGALAQIVPREAFMTVQGWDPRFNEGWGGEDGSFLRSVDTLYQQHEVMPGEVVHLWHGGIGNTWQTRQWKNQKHSGANSRLSHRYTRAQSEVGAMRELCDEHPLQW